MDFSLKCLEMDKCADVAGENMPLSLLYCATVSQICKEILLPQSKQVCVFVCVGGLIPTCISLTIIPTVTNIQNMLCVGALLIELVSV